MYIRRTKTKSLTPNEAYYTFRIVESIRLGKNVKQRTLLNLGKDFSIASEHWPLLCARIEQLLQNSTGAQGELFDLTDELNHLLEEAAQRYYELILRKHAQPVYPVGISTASANAGVSDAPPPDYHPVNINHIEAQHARSIGGETLAIHALQLDQKLTALGFNNVDLAAAIGSIIGRVVSPGSERHTLRWLNHTSCLGELIDFDYGNLSLTRLYKISDKLLNHQTVLETFLSTQEQTLFNLQRHIVLYDLTNTYFEGQCTQNPKAQFGRSKEKRRDCRLVTLGLVLDGDGFPLTSQVFSGNASEPATLQTMLSGLQEKRDYADSKPVVIMDAGIASEANIH